MARSTEPKKYGRITEGLKLPPRAPNRSNEEWTMEDYRMLKTYYRKYGSFYLSHALGRTPGAIRNEAYKRGITGSRREEWSEMEDRYILKNYPKRDVKAIMRTLGRSEQAVRARLRHHGLTQVRGFTWTKDEVAYLEQNYGRLKVQEMAQYLGRSEDSVSLKLARMGIREKSEAVRMTPKLERYIIDNLAVKSYTEIERKTGISVHRIRKIADAHGYRARPLSRLWTDEDEALLRRLWGTMTPEEVAARLNRHVTGVTARAGTLGLRTQKRGRTKAPR